MSAFDNLESRLQSLLEVQLVKYLPGYKVEDGIAQQLAARLHSNLREIEGRSYAPNLFVIVGHPATLTGWHAGTHLLRELADTLFTAGKEAGILFPVRPTVTTLEDSDLPPGELRVMASFSSDTVSETQQTSTEPAPEREHDRVPENAFLIIAGSRVFPLNRSVYNIGRRLDNQIVLEEPSVSRLHAQLRLVRDHFVLFDLNSRGGTFVNGARINQAVLHPGDVISLAGVTLVFGQETQEPPSSGMGQTEPIASLPARRRTQSPQKEPSEPK